MKTRQQSRQENGGEMKKQEMKKRSAVDDIALVVPRKRHAFCDLSNAISNVVIDSSKKTVTAANVVKTATNKLTTKKATTRRSGSNAATVAIASSHSSSSSSSNSTWATPVESPPVVVKKEEEEDPCPHYDYDKECEMDLFSVPFYAADIFRYYKSREKQFRVQPYLTQQPAVSKQMRAVLADWMVEVQENFELNHETLYQAVKLTDLYLGRVPNVKKDDLQLIASTAIFISSKFDERQPPLIDDFLYICEDAYEKEQLIALEQTMLKTIGFDIGAPLSYRFLRRYAKTSKMDMSTLTLARFILETTLMFYEFCSVSDSLMAAAAFLLAIRMKQLGDWTPVHRKYSGYTKEQVEPLMWKLNHMLIMRPRIYDSLTTIFSKYSHEVFFEVAKTPTLEGGPTDSEPIGPPPGL